MKNLIYKSLLTAIFCIVLILPEELPSHASTCMPKSGGSYASCVVTGDFSNADLSGSTFVDVEFKNVNLDGANFTNSTFRRTSGIFAERANFTGAKFIDSFFGPSDLGSCSQGFSLKESNFQKAIFFKTEFSCIINAEQALSSFSLMVDVTCNVMTNNPLPVHTIYVKKGNRLNGKHMPCVSGGSFWGFSKNNEYKASDFQNGVLDFSEWDLSGADLSGSSYTGVNLTNTNFLGSNLTDVSFERSTFGDSKFEGSNLERVHLRELPSFPLGFCFQGSPASIPERARILGNCIINKEGGSSLIRANFEGLDLTKASFFSCTSCNLRRTNLAGLNTANLDASNLTGADISKMSLTNISFTGATLEGLNLSRKNLRGSNLAGANLSRTNLTYADLSTTTLEGAVLANSNVTGAIFPSSKSLLMVKSGRLRGVPKKLPSNWKVINGWLVGPGADLGGSNLTNRDLSSISLSGANLQSASLAGAKLSSKATSFRIIGTPKSLPKGWSFSKGQITKRK